MPVIVKVETVNPIRSFKGRGTWVAVAALAGEGRIGPDRDVKGLALCGAEIAITSDVPSGAGLSSSAALEIAAGYALLDLAGHPIDLTRLALAAQQAEHEFAGTRCGIIDQFIACHGRADHAMLLDTRTLEATWLPLPPSHAIVVCNTMTKHALASDGYNARRADCEAGVRALAVRLPRIRALRDVTFADLEANKDVLEDRVYRRCRHVVTENARTLSAADALRDGDLARFGVLMGASHASLRDDYDVGAPELDAMVEAAMDAPGSVGARMTGGGFGGCTVSLVRADAVEAFTREVGRRYEAESRQIPEIYACRASRGAHMIGLTTYE